MSQVRRIAIDKIAVKKGHSYLTVVMDLEQGNVIHVGEGKGGVTLEKFWKRLKISGAKIECVSVDLSPAYTAAVEKNLPDAVIVYDHFHVIQRFNHMLTKARRELYNKLTDKEQKSTMKGIRYLLLKNTENLDPVKGEPERLKEALKMNKPLMDVLPEGRFQRSLEAEQLRRSVCPACRLACMCGEFEHSCGHDLL